MFIEAPYRDKIITGEAAVSHQVRTTSQRALQLCDHLYNSLLLWRAHSSTPVQYTSMGQTSNDQFRKWANNHVLSPINDWPLITEFPAHLVGYPPINWFTITSLFAQMTHRIRVIVQMTSSTFNSSSSQSLWWWATLSFMWRITGLSCDPFSRSLFLLLPDTAS